jgi:hypothetical protein
MEWAAKKSRNKKVGVGGGVLKEKIYRRRRGRKDRREVVRSEYFSKNSWTWGALYSMSAVWKREKRAYWPLLA